MARISTIFGPNESSCRNLFFEKVSNERNERNDFKKSLEPNSQKFRNTFNYCSYSGGGGNNRSPRLAEIKAMLATLCVVAVADRQVINIKDQAVARGGLRS